MAEGQPFFSGPVGQRRQDFLEQLIEIDFIVAALEFAGFHFDHFQHLPHHFLQPVAFTLNHTQEAVDLPSHRRRRVAELARQEGRLRVALRESNTWTSTVYSGSIADDAFFFFADGTPIVAVPLEVYRLIASPTRFVSGKSRALSTLAAPIRTIP